MLPQIGGNFAPPLTDELLAEYKTMIDGLPDSPVRDGLHVAYNCCTKWWELPESSMDGAALHGSGRAIQNPLDKEIAAALYDHIPWPKEIAALGELFDEIEADVASANSKSVEAWQRSVATAIVDKHFPDKERFKTIAEALAGGEAWLPLVSDEVKKDVAEFKERNEAYQKEVVAAIKAKSHPDFPYPTPAPTKLRDAAHHLLWHVVELNNDREPMTNDKLVKPKPAA